MAASGAPSGLGSCFREIVINQGGGGLPAQASAPHLPATAHAGSQAGERHTTRTPSGSTSRRCSINLCTSSQARATVAAPQGWHGHRADLASLYFVCKGIQTRFDIGHAALGTPMSFGWGS